MPAETPYKFEYFYEQQSLSWLEANDFHRSPFCFYDGTPGIAKPFQYDHFAARAHKLLVVSDNRMFVNLESSFFDAVSSC